MKKLLIALLLCSSFMTDSFGQLLSEDSLALIAYWEQGEQKRYEHIKRKLEVENGKTQSDASSKSIVSFKVMEATNESYLLEYKTEKTATNLTDGYPNAQQLLEKLSKDFRYEFQTTEMGELVELKNWEELSEATNKMVKMLMRMQGGDAQEQKQALQVGVEMMKQLTGTRQGMEALMAKEIGVFYSYHGYVYGIDKEIKSKEEMPNMLGGKPFPAESIFKVGELDEENKTIKFSSTLTIDTEASKEIIVATLKEMFLKVNEGIGQEANLKQMEKQMEKIQYEMTQKHYSIYNYETGWLIESNVMKKITANIPGQENVYSEEERTFKLVE